jgi:prepilin-type processing-associated H-X9-DG protein
LPVALLETRDKASVGTPNANNSEWSNCSAATASVSTIVNFDSYHSGGINACMGDGSVKFIKISINQSTWWSLGTRGNGEVISADQYRAVIAPENEVGGGEPIGFSCCLLPTFPRLGRGFMARPHAVRWLALALRMAGGGCNNPFAGFSSSTHFAAFQSPIVLPSGSANQAKVPLGIVTGGTTVLPPSDSAFARAAGTSSTST